MKTLTVYKAKEPAAEAPKRPSFIRALLRGIILSVLLYGAVASSVFIVFGEGIHIQMLNLIIAPLIAFVTIISAFMLEKSDIGATIRSLGILFWSLLIPFMALGLGIAYIFSSTTP